MIRPPPYRYTASNYHAAFILLLCAAWFSAQALAGSAFNAIVHSQQATINKVETFVGSTKLTVETKPTNKKSGGEKVITVSDPEVAKSLQNAKPASEIVVPVISKEDGRDSLAFKTKATQEWTETVDKKLDAKEQTRVEGVTTAVSKVDDAVASYLKDPTQANEAARDQSYAGTLDQLIEAYANATDPEVRTRLAQVYSSMGTEQKAWYGRDDNYRPEVYKAIYDTASSCVALVDQADDRPFASGALIGEDLILTCSHQVADRDADDLQVWFDYESGNPNDPRIEKCKVLSRVFNGTPPRGDPTLSPLDFSVWKIQRPPGAKARQPLKLITKRVRRGVPIYLIGHPQRAPQTVHDNAWILFPFEASQNEMKELRIAVNAELIGRKGSSALLTDHFMKSYVPIPVPGGDRIFRYIGDWGGRRLPLIGVDSDTFKGDSGSPAILREKGAVIGILIEGQPDQGEFGSNPTRETHGYHAGWTYHERVLPIREIVSELDDSVTDWRTLYKPAFSN
jgi:trypsin-like peptidase